jgi:hypothetical protein
VIETDVSQARAARNQALFREVNARLVDLNEVFEALSERSTFVCECASIACIQEIEISLTDYQRVRADPRRFIVAPSDDHVFPDAERVVERAKGYFVVEKVGVAATIAETHMPVAHEPS